MIRFAEAYPDPEILYAMRTKLSWTHLRGLVFIDDPLARDFYAQMCRIEGWNTRTLDKKIQGMLYERTALSEIPRRWSERSSIPFGPRTSSRPTSCSAIPIGWHGL